MAGRAFEFRQLRGRRKNECRNGKSNRRRVQWLPKEIAQFFRGGRQSATAGADDAPQAAKFAVQERFAQVVFPHAKHMPAEAAQFARGADVAGDVAVDFLFPKTPVGRRNLPVRRAAMPETTIDKHRNARGGENEIGTAEAPPPRAKNLVVMVGADINAGFAQAEGHAAADTFCCARSRKIA